MAKSCGAPDGGNQDPSSPSPDTINRDATDAGPSNARPDPVEALERPVEAIELGPVEIEIDGGVVVDVDRDDDDEIVDDDDSNERILVDNRTPDRATCRPNSVAKKPPRRLKSETERFLRANLFADKAVRSPSEHDSCDDERAEHDDDDTEDDAADDDDRPDSVIEVDGEPACDVDAVDGPNPRTRRKRKLEPRSDAFPHKKPFGGGPETTSPAAADRSHRCRAVIPTRDNPPPEMAGWLDRFEHWSNAERLLALDALVSLCEPTQVRHVMRTIEPQFQRDFISLLPRELALTVLSFLGPKDLLTAARTCRGWRTLADDNLLWRDVCRRAGVDAPVPAERSQARRRGRGRSPAPVHASPWKAAFMRRHVIDFNWRSAPLREPKVLKGHDDHVITCLQFCGNRIVSGSDDNTLKVWSATTGRCLRTLVGHTGGVWSSQMRGSVIVSGSTDRTLKVWNAETGACVHTLYGHTSTVRCMHLHGDRVVSGSRDATLRVWDVATGECLRVLVGHHAAVRCVQYDGRLIVSGAYDYTVKVWCAEREECLHTLTGHRNRVYSLQFDGVHVVSGSLDTSIRVWCAESGALKSTLVGHQSLTSGMELRGDVLVSGNADSTVKVWDVASGRCLRTLAGPNKHRSAVTCLQFDGRHVVTSSDDGTVKLWDVRTGAFVRDLVALDSGGSGGVVWRIRASETKLVCAVGSRNGTEETKLLVLDFDVDTADATPPSTQVPSDPFAEPALDA